LSNTIPRLVIAGTNSGVGKTSVALALVSALRRRGLRVQPFKVGPDYLDPTYLSVAAGRPCYNLDGWMTGKDYVCSLFVDRARTADIAVVEGVMGLFDGSDPVSGEGSTAEIAAWLDAPVILVVNVHGMARSVAAAVKGYAELDPTVKIVGVVANQSGSERHSAWLNESLAAFGLPELVAAFPRGSFPELPRRHLGLVTADNGIVSDAVLTSMADAMEQHANVDKMVSIARSAADLAEYGCAEFDKPHVRIVRVGVSKDAAFHFYYPDNLEALAQAGCELIEFSPLTDSAAPNGLDALYLGGGYPEEHAEQLSANLPMLDSIRRFAASGRPIYAECGGLMYLAQGIETRDGRRFELVGLLPHWTRMLDRLRSLGYVEVTLLQDSLFGRRGTSLRGHEFHYSELVDDPAASGLWTAAYLKSHRRALSPEPEGFQRGRVLASYVHTHFASRPGAAEHFVSVCRAV